MKQTLAGRALLLSVLSTLLLQTPVSGWQDNARGLRQRLNDRDHGGEVRAYRSLQTRKMKKPVNLAEDSIEEEHIAATQFDSGDNMMMQESSGDPAFVPGDAESIEDNDPLAPDTEPPEVVTPTTAPAGFVSVNVSIIYFLENSTASLESSNLFPTEDVLLATERPDVIVTKTSPGGRRGLQEELLTPTEEEIDNLINNTFDFYSQVYQEAFDETLLSIVPLSVVTQDVSPGVFFLSYLALLEFSSAPPAEEVAAVSTNIDTEEYIEFYVWPSGPYFSETEQIGVFSDAEDDLSTEEPTETATPPPTQEAIETPAQSPTTSPTDFPTSIVVETASPTLNPTEGLADTAPPTKGEVAETAEPTPVPVPETDQPTEGDEAKETSEPTAGKAVETTEPTAGVPELPTGIDIVTTVPTAGELVETAEPTEDEDGETAEPTSGEVVTAAPTADELVETAEPTNGDPQLPLEGVTAAPTIAAVVTAVPTNSEAVETAEPTVLVVETVAPTALEVPETATPTAGVTAGVPTGGDLPVVDPPPETPSPTLSGTQAPTPCPGRSIRVSGTILLELDPEEDLQEPTDDQVVEVAQHILQDFGVILRDAYGNSIRGFTATIDETDTALDGNAYPLAFDADILFSPCAPPTEEVNAIFADADYPAILANFEPAGDDNVFQHLTGEATYTGEAIIAF